MSADAKELFGEFARLNFTDQRELTETNTAGGS